jgi:hypothetical protein
MVEEQTAKGKEPHEEEQKQSAIKMQLAIPPFEGHPQTGTGTCFGWDGKFSG